MMRSLSDYAVGMVMALTVALSGLSNWDGPSGDRWIWYRAGLNPAVMAQVYTEDDHGGLRGEGRCLEVFDCPWEVFEPVRSKWKLLPLAHDLDKLLNVRVTNGWYCFIDRRAVAAPPDEDSSAFDRSAINGSLFLYDAETERLYHWEINT